MRTVLLALGSAVAGLLGLVVSALALWGVLVVCCPLLALFVFGVAVEQLLRLVDLL